MLAAELPPALAGRRPLPPASAGNFWPAPLVQSPIGIQPKGRIQQEPMHALLRAIGVLRPTHVRGGCVHPHQMQPCRPCRLAALAHATKAISSGKTSSQEIAADPLIRGVMSLKCGGCSPLAQKPLAPRVALCERASRSCTPSSDFPSPVGSEPAILAAECRRAPWRPSGCSAHGSSGKSRLLDHCPKSAPRRAPPQQHRQLS